jgi:L-lysine 2,3-aminomutase
MILALNSLLHAVDQDGEQLYDDKLIRIEGISITRSKKMPRDAFFVVATVLEIPEISQQGLLKINHKMRYQQLNYLQFRETEYCRCVPIEEQAQLNLLTKVFPFKTNNYVLENLIDWDNIPHDPMYRLLFPRKEMLSEADFLLLQESSQIDPEDATSIGASLNIRKKMQPLVPTYSTSYPEVNGTRLHGAYRSFGNQLTLIARPMASTCHAYCSYCYRWIAFGDSEIQADGYSEPNLPAPYLKSHPEIEEVLFTGADALITKSATLRKFVEPILAIESIKKINISTKSLAWWPFRFTTDNDAKGLLALFAEIMSSGKQLNIIAHFTHDHELDPIEVKIATEQILKTGAIIKTQGPIVKDINDATEVWTKIWRKQVAMGMVPTYMFIEADHSPESCFRIPLAKSLRIFQEAQRQCDGLASTVIGPLFMNDIYRVLLGGTTERDGKRYFVLKGLQGPPGTHIENEIRYVPYDEHTKTVGNIVELFDQPVKNESQLLMV